MEKINTEELISSLLLLGFEKVDLILYTQTLGRLVIDNQTLKIFEFDDHAFSDTFNKYVEYDEGVYKLKEGYSLDTNIKVGKKDILLKDLLHTNKRLITYLNLLDFEEIIFKKITLLEDKSISTLPNYFSNKEKEIIYKMFGIAAMHHKKAIERAIAYENIYEEEAHSMDSFAIDDFLNDIIIRDEEITKINSTEDYINWLKKFTEKHPGFCFDDWSHDQEDLTDEDLYNVRRLNIFYDAIEEYASEKHLEGMLQGEGHYYLIKHEDSNFKVGFISGQGTLFYLDRVAPSENAIDYNNVIAYNNRRKTKSKKRTI